MNSYDQELEVLRSQVQQKSKLQSALKQLAQQRKELQKEEKRLKKLRLLEEEDVKKATGYTLSAFLSRIMGNHQQRIDKEEAEAYAAAVKHESICAQLASAEADIQDYEDKLLETRSCEKRYQELLTQKSEALKQANPEKGEEICRLEEEIGYLQGQAKEVSEAIDAGRRVGEMLGEVSKSLGSAENWGMVDVLGGGAITHIAKHSHLDDAQSKLNQLQILLNRYTVELADIRTEHHIEVKTGSFLTFADFFLDGFFTDFMVLNHIERSQGKINEIKSKTTDLQSKLLDTKTELTAKLEKKRQELKEYITEAAL